MCIDLSIQAILWVVAIERRGEERERDIGLVLCDIRPQGVKD